MAALLRAVSVLDRLRWLVLLAWMLFVCWAVREQRAQRYFKLLELNQRIISREQHRASAAMGEAIQLTKRNAYPLRLLVIVSALQPNVHVTDPVVSVFMRNLGQVLEKDRHIISVEGYGLNANSTIGAYSDTRRFISHDRSQAILYVKIPRMNIRENFRLFDDIEREIQQICAKASDFAQNFNAVIVHESEFLRDAKNATIHDFALADLLTIVIALLILLRIVGGLAFCALPILLSSSLLGFTLTIHYEQSYHFEIWQPSVIISLAVALAFDYSLFLLSGFRNAMSATSPELRCLPEHVCRCTASALSLSGHPVLLSGIILGVSFVSLIRIEQDAVCTLGIGGALMVLSSLISTFTLLPVLLLILGRHPEVLAPCAAVSRKLRCLNGLSTLLFGSNFGVRMRQAPELWSKVAEMCSSRPRSVLLVFVLCFLLALPIAARLRVTSEDLMLVPKSSPHLQAFQRMQTSGLRGGLISPVYAVVQMSSKALIDFASVDRSHVRTPCKDNDVLFAAEAALFFPEAGRLSCASADQMFDLCTNSFREHVLYLCPFTCGKCRWQPRNTHSDTCQVMASLKDKMCRANLQKPDKTTAEQCRDSCCNDVACTFWQFTGSRCEHAVGMTKPVCQDANVPVQAELIYRPSFDPRIANPYLDARMWNITQETMARLRKVLNDIGWPCFSCVSSISETPDGKLLRPDEVMSLLDSNLSYAKHFLSLVGVGGTHVAQHIRIQLPFSPFSFAGEQFLGRFSDELLILNSGDEMKGDRCCHVFLLDLLQNIVESMQATFSSMWRVAATLCAVVVFVLIVAFRSLAIPVRLLSTIMFTGVIVSAGAVIRFQFSSRLAGLYWYAPICAAPIIIGLTLDFDLFLLTRVEHYRVKGFSTCDAVIRGCAKTGQTISFAGIIMSAAFSSMLWSDVWVIQQFGFLLVLASVVDAFLVRAVLVPAVMLAVSSESNWWPRKMPPVTHTAHDDSSDEEADVMLKDFTGRYLNVDTDMEGADEATIF